MKQQLAAFYRDWVNNFLTVDSMAQYYGIDHEDCIILIEIGKKYHEEMVELINKSKNPFNQQSKKPTR